MKYDKLIERLQKLKGFTPKQAELCKILEYTPSKVSARAQRNSDFSDEEIENEVKKVINELNATSIKDMGKVMGVATRQLAGKAEGKAISEMVKKLLS